MIRLLTQEIINKSKNSSRPVCCVILTSMCERYINYLEKIYIIMCVCICEYDFLTLTFKSYKNFKHLYIIIVRKLGRYK